MSLSETCTCGASFSAERDDELKLLNQWRRAHKCVPQPGDLYTSGLDSRADLATDYTLPEMHIGFRYEPEDDE